MPEYLAPGVYVEEIERGPKPIEGVATSTAAFLGATERGPSRPRLVTSYSEYLRSFGGIFADAAYVPYAVRTFFDNGGRRAYIARISGANAATRDGRRRRVHASRPRASEQRTTGCRSASTRGPPRTAPATRVGFRLRVWYWDKAGPDVPYDRGRRRRRDGPAGTRADGDRGLRRPEHRAGRRRRTS